MENQGGSLASPVLVSPLDERSTGFGAPMISEARTAVSGGTTFLRNTSGSVIGGFAITAGGWYTRRRWLGSTPNR